MNNYSKQFLLKLETWASNFSWFNCVVFTTFRNTRVVIEVSTATVVTFPRVNFTTTAELFLWIKDLVTAIWRSMGENNWKIQIRWEWSMIKSAKYFLKNCANYKTFIKQIYGNNFFQKGSSFFLFTLLKGDLSTRW